MLATLKSNLAVHLRSLKSLELVDLKRIQLLTRIHWLLDESHLSLWQLYKLRLAAILKVPDRAYTLIHRSPIAVAWLETALLLLTLTKAAHLTLLILWGSWSLRRLVSPVTLEVSR